MDAVTNADVTLDCQGKLCPLPVIEVSKAMRQMESGQTLLLIADDPGSDPDMHAWCEETGNPLLGMEKDGRTFRFLIRKEG